MQAILIASLTLQLESRGSRASGSRKLFITTKMSKNRGKLLTVRYRDKLVFIDRTIYVLNARCIRGQKVVWLWYINGMCLPRISSQYCGDKLKKWS